MTGPNLGPDVRLTILLPSLNEVEGIQRTLHRVPQAALAKAGYDVEILVVDGASNDGTPQRARALGAHVIAEPRRGYGRAYKTGFAAAQGDIVVTGDADDTYPLDALPEYLGLARERGLDFATLDRFSAMHKGSMTRTNRFGNGVLSLTARHLHRVRIRDSQSGMWILSRKALQRIRYNDLSDGMAFSQELKIAAFRDPELQSAEIPGKYYLRVGHEKLLRWTDGLGNLKALIRRRFRKRPWP
jgi:hypothetical protein